MKNIEIEIEVRQSSWLPSFMSGWGNGYVKVTKGHPWYGKPYFEIEGVDVHGGLTYSKQEDKYWVVGFDTAHALDDAKSCDKKYVIAETMKLKKQAIAAMKLLNKTTAGNLKL